MLRDPRLGIDDSPLDLISEVFGQGLENNPESVALIVVDEVFHVFKQKGPRSVVRNNPGNIKEQCSLRLTAEAMRQMERIFLGNPSYRKRLARKACDENIMLWNICSTNLGDVPGNLVCIAREIGKIGLLAECIPLGSKNTPSPYGFEPPAEPTNTGK